MTTPAADALVRAVLYEGYLLYPYRSSSVKNRYRHLFGTLAPAGSVEASSMRTECLVRGSASVTIDVRVRFLQLPASPDRGEAPNLDAVEREVAILGASLTNLEEAPREQLFTFEGGRPRSTGSTSDASVIAGTLRACACRVGDDAFRITVDIENTTPPRPDVELSLLSLSSTHTILVASGGTFCSLADPPDDLRAHAVACRNVGCWPALLAHDAVLSSPIILPDFPAVAPESLGDLFDATEIDEILTLRILTLTEDEKDEIRRGGGRASALLERTESLGATEVSRLHGALRQKSARHLRPGDRVKLAPRARADAFDLVLSGRSATVASIEEDFEGQVYVAVTVDDDPGQDLGRAGQPGHRFFFKSDEVEPLP